MSAPRPRHLTCRELTVFAVYLRHSNRKAAAADLGISPDTVSRHLATLYDKLHVESHTEAAIALGWLVIPPDVTNGMA